MRPGRAGPADKPALVREALRLASGTEDPDVSRLVAAVPGLMAEARRRRATEQFALVSTVAAGAWRAVPRLALVTALALVLASLMLVVDRQTPAPRATNLESVILNGSGSDTGDVLLDAVLAERRNDG